jgi:hypothetical protein
MTSLLTEIAVGGVIGACGAVLAGLSLVALRVLLSKSRREHERLILRELGLIAATKKALFEEPDPEFRFPSHSRSSQAAQ